MGTLDGPGVRFVVFVQGCNLRCKCCHNPDTWDVNGGTVYTADDLIAKIIRYKTYFGNDGGVTVSGGEPLMQPVFVRELFELCHQNGINTCLDTSGSILNDNIKAMLSVTDRVLLDIKYTTDGLYISNVGCSMTRPMEFLEYLDTCGIAVTLRQVIIPGYNDSEENINKIKAIKNKYSCIDGAELLPFRKICQTKYDNMKLEFPFKDVPQPSAELMKKLNNILLS